MKEDNSTQSTNTSSRRRLLLKVLFCSGLAAAWTYQNQQGTHLPDFPGASPWSDRQFLDDSDEFQFAIVSDRNGSHRWNVLYLMPYWTGFRAALGRPSD